MRIVAVDVVKERPALVTGHLEELAGGLRQFSPMGNPPALLEDSRSLAAPGVVAESVFREPLKVYERKQTMQIYESLKHTTWECKYHVVFIPKYRRKTLFAQLRRELGTVFRSLAEQKQCTVEEGHLMPDHVHMLLSVPPKYSVASVMGFIKGKSAIHIARVYAGRRRNFVGQHFWARGYWVSTVGKNEAAVRRYIQEQEKEDQRFEQLEMAAL